MVVQRNCHTSFFTFRRVLVEVEREKYSSNNYHYRAGSSLSVCHWKINIIGQGPHWEVNSHAMTNIIEQGPLWGFVIEWLTL